jgi:hypothetical protein
MYFILSLVDIDLSKTLRESCDSLGPNRCFDVMIDNELVGGIGGEAGGMELY